MRHSCSPARLAANRANATKSTGPKSPQGKARSARNALKHGLLAREVVITDGDGAENHRDFAKLLSDLSAVLNPRDFVEETLVERIATCQWRLRRAHRFEMGLLRGTLDDCNRDETDGRHRKKLQDAIDRATAALHKDERVLDLIENPPDVENPKIRAEFEAAIADFSIRFQLDRMRGTGKLVNTSACSGLPLEIQARNGLNRAIADHKAKIADLEAQLPDAERSDALCRSRRPLEASLPANDNLIKLVRYETMLDRHIHRALCELRKRRARDSDPPEQKEVSRLPSQGRGQGEGFPFPFPNEPTESPIAAQEPGFGLEKLASFGFAKGQSNPTQPPIKPNIGGIEAIGDS